MTFPAATSGRRVIARLLEAAGWLGVAAMAALVLSEYVSTDAPAVAAAQTMLPYLLAPSIPLSVIATLCRRSALALSSAVIGIVLLVYTFPVVFPPGLPSVAADAPRVSVLEGNLYVFNDGHQVVPKLLASGADVLVLLEYTDDVDGQLHDAGASDLYPFSELRPSDSKGIGIWSKYPLSNASFEEVVERPALTVTLDVDGSPMRIVAVHPRPPSSPDGAAVWEPSLRGIGDVAGSPGPPTMIVGDFNASRWHPAFRDLLDRGWRDAHEWLGHGFSGSWPNDERIGPWVRLDHALLGAGIAPVSIRDVDLPGSDHRGFVITVAV